MSSASNSCHNSNLRQFETVASEKPKSFAISLLGLPSNDIWQAISICFVLTRFGMPNPPFLKLAFLNQLPLIIQAKKGFVKRKPNFILI